MFFSPSRRGRGAWRLVCLHLLCCHHSATAVETAVFFGLRMTCHIQCPRRALFHHRSALRTGLRNTLLSKYRVRLRAAMLFCNALIVGGLLCFNILSYWEYAISNVPAGDQLLASAYSHFPGKLLYDHGTWGQNSLGS